MVETSLEEIFSGDVPRIDSMVIALDPTSMVYKSNLMSASAQVLDDYVVGFNLSPSMLGGLKQHFPEVTPVILVRTEDGFKVESGTLPKYFQGTFSLEYRVFFREQDLPADNERIQTQVRVIKSIQAELDRGWVGFSAYAINGSLWSQVRGLSVMVESPE